MELSASIDGFEKYHSAHFTILAEAAFNFGNSLVAQSLIASSHSKLNEGMSVLRAAHQNWF